jgi:hypothetical protein
LIAIKAMLGRFGSIIGIRDAEEAGMAMKWKYNVGWHDRAIRIGIGLAIVAAIFIWQVDPRWLAVIALFPILTAVGGWCPIYEVLGMTTDTTESRED